MPEQQLGSTVEAIRVRLHRPLVVFRLALDFSSRNDLSFGLATESDVDERGIIGYHTCRAFYNQGGDYPMQGQYMPGNIEIALDLTEYMTEERRGGETFYLNILRGFRGKVKGTGASRPSPSWTTVGRSPWNTPTVAPYQWSCATAATLSASGPQKTLPSPPQPFVTPTRQAT